jgi:2,4-dienoyl-CoA reductase-like NADH-dependent reductase (Old Yellow Enzyme family)
MMQASLEREIENAFKARKLGLGRTQLKNAFIKSATFEGMYKEGIPTQGLIDHHVAMAKGDVAMTTVSYGAVSPDGRTFDSQMYIHEGSLEKLKLLASEVHKAGGKVSMQLTHCGYFSKNKAFRKPLAPSRIFNEYGFLSGIVFSKAMTKEDILDVANAFGDAALKLKKIGFDAVEIHMGHGYLLSQFLSPWTNKRKDDYGGSIENRVRFPLEVLANVRAKVGPDFPILAKLNLDDGFKKGFSLEDCKYVAQRLEKHSCDAIVLSGGFTSKTPFYLMRGEVPLKGMIKNASSLAEKITMTFFGPLIVKKYPFTSHFFLDQAKEIRKVVKMPLVYLGGVDSKNGIEEIMAAGFDFIAIARALIHDSSFLQKIQKGEIDRSACTRCNECVVEMDREQGVRCVI